MADRKGHKDDERKELEKVEEAQASYADEELRIPSPEEIFEKARKMYGRALDNLAK